MTKTRKSSGRKARLGTAVFFAGLTAGAVVGPGMANAAVDDDAYPPQSSTTIVDSGDQLPPDQGVPSVEVQAAGSLPSTGNSDVTSSLMIAGAALLAGVAVTGVAAASRRRDHTDPGTTPS